jgi:DNA-binding MarR family transcriptional regulator
MTMEKAARDVLRYLFAEYLKGPALVYSTASVTRKYSKIDPVELSDYMLMFEWIRERWIHPDNTFACRITMRGIEEINAAYVREKLRQVIGGLGAAGGARPLVDILEYKLEEYSIALDLIRQLEGMGFVAIRHPQNTIVIELTEKGKRYYEKGSSTFFTLMTY